MTNGRSSFHKKNLNGATFTSDPFSCLNQTNSGQCGFGTRGMIGLRSGEDASSVIVTQFKSCHRITKVGAKSNRKALSLTYNTKVINANDRVKSHCYLLGARADRLEQVANRVKKLNKTN